MPRSARWWLILAATSLLLPGCGSEPEPVGQPPGAIGSGSPPNLVLLVIDTLRADHLGCYGYPHPTSPVLDKLAAQGVRVAEFMANASWTRPSVATLLTGFYGRTAGIYEERWDALADALETLPERLSARGYVTLGATANPTLNASFGFDQGFDEYLSSNVLFHDMEPIAQAGDVLTGDPSSPLLDAADITDRAIELVDRHEESLGSRPLYLQLVYIDPHPPRDQPKKSIARMRRSGSLTPRYDAEIRYVDSEIGRLLEQLRKRGLLENTLVVLTSDHGEGLLDHPQVPYGETHGGTLYESVLHVPLIFFHDDLPAGRVVEPLTAMIDLVPTLAELLGIEIPTGSLPGHSFATLLTGRGPAPELPKFVFSETDFRMFEKQAIRSATHRLIANHASRAYRRDGTFEGRVLEPLERQALMSFPDEELHRVGAREHPQKSNRLSQDAAIANSLRDRLDAWQAATQIRPPHGRDPDDVLTLGDGRVVAAEGVTPSAAPDDETVEQLKAMGYLGADAAEGRATP